MRGSDYDHFAGWIKRLYDSSPKRSQIVIDVCLCKVIRKFLKIQYGLGYLQTIGVDSTVRVLSQAEFLCEKRTDAKPSAIQACLVMAEVRRRKTKLNAIAVSWYGLNRLVQISV